MYYTEKGMIVQLKEEQKVGRDTERRSSCWLLVGEDGKDAVSLETLGKASKILVVNMHGANRPKAEALCTSPNSVSRIASLVIVENRRTSSGLVNSQISLGSNY